MKFRACLLAMSLAVVAPFAANAAVIGTNTSAESISLERIKALPQESRAAWETYLTRSQEAYKADQAALAAERKGLAAVPAAPSDHLHDKSMPLDREPSWYGSAEARHIADNIVSFQTPAGGWGKNHDRTGPLRQRGQAYVPSETTLADIHSPDGLKWAFVGTIDNGATTTELRFLARVAKAVPGADGDAYRASFLKGLRYLLAAQFPNGGWPQIYPLQGGYHDAITYNDDAVTHAAEVMAGVAANGNGEFDFVPADLRAAAGASDAKALEVMLATQVMVNGRLTVWGQQHDALTLKPTPARNFEPVSLSSAESANLLVYLMSIESPSPRLAASIRAGIAFLQEVTITNITLTPASEGRHAMVKEGSSPLWARFYDPVSLRPIFGDRDKTIHDDLNDLQAERRAGYAYYVTTPQKALKAYAKWSQAHPAP